MADAAESAGGGGGGGAVEGAGDGAGAGGERGAGRAPVPHLAQAGPHGGGHPVAQRRGGAARLLPRGGVDRGAQEARRRLQALHQAGEHRHPDVRRRLLRPRRHRGGGAFMLAMDQKTYELIGTDYPGNRPEDVKNPSLGWMIGFMCVVSFLGLFSLVALRKVMVIDYKLTFPSGTATAALINSVHTTSASGANLAKKKVRWLGKYLSISFLWNCFKWFFSGVGDSCGFDNFPLLGLAALKNTFYFDFSPTYIRCGLLNSHIVNCSTLLGAIISWGFPLDIYVHESWGLISC
ncbi:hypothetical protein ACP70R_011701 [Stipagrostis hirtigluma subsp. patula]